MSEVLLKNRVYKALSAAFGALSAVEQEGLTELPCTVDWALEKVQEALDEVNESGWAPSEVDI